MIFSIAAPEPLPCVTPEVQSELKGAPLGSGKFSDVFEMTVDGRRVAVKKPKEGCRENAKREYHMLDGMSHPNIISVLWFDPQTSIFAMPLCKTDLFEVLAGGAAVPDELVLRQIGSAIAYMHFDAGFVHCDIKPENVLVEVVEGKWILRLADFGLSTRRNCEGRHYMITSPVGSNR